MSGRHPTIALFGGAFDPVHLGHEAIVRYLCDHCSYDTIHVMPYARSAFGKQPIASAAHRLAMLHVAFKGLPPKVVVDDREVVTGKVAYTIDTVRAMHDAMPQALLDVVLSEESLADVPRWKSWEALLERVRLVYVGRAGSKHVLADSPLAPYCTNHPLATAPRKSIVCLPCEPPGHASRTIRSILAQHAATWHSHEQKSMVMAGLSEPVAKYIHEHGLYQTVDSKGY